MGAEDQNEASDQGWEEGDLWQGGDGEGEACEDDRQGLLCVSPEEEHLSLFVRCAHVDTPHVLPGGQHVSGPWFRCISHIRDQQTKEERRMVARSHVHADLVPRFLDRREGWWW